MKIETLQDEVRINGTPEILCFQVDPEHIANLIRFCILFCETDTAGCAKMIPAIIESLRALEG